MNLILIKLLWSNLKNELNIKQIECENELIKKQEEVLELKESTESLMLKMTDMDNI